MKLTTTVIHPPTESEALAGRIVDHLRTHQFSTAEAISMALVVERARIKEALSDLVHRKEVEESHGRVSFFNDEKDWRYSLPPKSVDHYRGAGGKPYEHPRGGYSSCCIEVLKFLWNRKLDAVTMAYVHALRPSSVRICDGAHHLDARRWRVTVDVNKHDDIVERITQEVEVALPEGVEHGHALEHALKYGLDSPQVKWHRDADGYVCAPEGFFKTTDGKMVPFPKPRKKTGIPICPKCRVPMELNMGYGYVCGTCGAEPDK